MIFIETTDTKEINSTPLSPNAQLVAAALGLLTAGPLGALAGWWAIRLQKGKWNLWIVTGLVAAPLLLTIQLALIGSLQTPSKRSAIIETQADEEIEDSRPKEALKILDDYVNSNPDNPTAWYLRGKAKIKLEDYQGSIKDLTKAIELKPSYFEAYILRSESQSTLRMQQK